ncbi:SMI1/KNR4 family protein [Chitinophaga agrisoli]|uniref:SMI1/KNR4 family protein n=1 Tax=Chitinophaga agrisoli TaxID=2607653 RepID=A0A5B2VVR5_9BACT|nr:SMI1/KNR4 family protein [Chitinophaga agrisoli]KAA2242770.1 SMI1/KNR4 family protein [Chitinophaga agrisoli]
MTYFQKIRHLYGIPEDENFGLKESEIVALEKRLNIELPATLRAYYLSLGSHESLNNAHNRLLRCEEVWISQDGYLMFYEENQGVVSWGVKKENFMDPDPLVYGNYSSSEADPDWHLEFPLAACLLMLAVYNGVLGGLLFNGNCLEAVKPEVIDYIKDNWQELEDLSNSSQRIYTRDYTEVITLSFDENQNCSGIFIGTNNRDRFNDMLDHLDVGWFYLSIEDMDDEEDEYEDE